MSCDENMSCDEIRDTDCKEHGCGKCCSHTHNAVRITLENGEDLDCAIVGIFDIEDKAYIALLPEGNDGVIIYRYRELDGGEVELGRIDDDAEYEEVGEVFLKLYEETDDDTKNRE